MLHPQAWSAALWAAFSVRSVRRQLSRGVIRPSIPSWAPTGKFAAFGTEAVLERLSATCLEAALVRQELLLVRGDPRDVILGIPPNGLNSKAAHAWVDGLDVASPSLYRELYRIPPGAVPKRELQAVPHSGY